MKNYLLPIFTLLFVGCGNRIQQTSNDEILNEDLNRTNTQYTLDSILHICTEKAQIYYENYHHPLNLAIAYYDDEFVAFVDTLERIYQPYKERITSTIVELPVEDGAYDSNLSLEFAQDTLWLNASAFFLEHRAISRYDIGVCDKYYYVKLRRLIDKYYCYLLKAANSNVRTSLPKIHKQWLDLLAGDIEMSARLDKYKWITLQNIFDMMKQRLLFYYHCTQSNTTDDYL